MAISTYVLVGFLRRDRRSNEAALKYLLLGSVLVGHLRLWAFAALRSDRQHEFSEFIRNSCTVRSIRSTGRSRIIALVTTLTGLFFKIAAIPLPPVGARRL